MALNIDDVNTAPKENQPEHHQQADRGVESHQITMKPIFNNPAILKYVLIAVVLLLIINTMGTFFNSFRSTPAPPNKELIDYLEKQRASYQISEAASQQKHDAELKQASDRQHYDSLNYLQMQNTLIKAINNFKKAYENIPDYSVLPNDSLHRIISARARQ